MKKLLSNLFVFKNNIQTVHWKLTGKGFISIHKFTDVMNEEVGEFIDRVVEKFIQKNIKVNTSLKHALETATIEEELKGNISVKEGIEKLLSDGRTILKQAEEFESTIKYGAMYLVIDDLREYLEKTLWMLKKSL